MSGLPCVVRRDDSYESTIIDNYNGFLCKSDKEMIEKIKLLLNDNEMSKKFAKNSIEVSKNLTSEGHAKRFEEIYTKLDFSL